MRAYDDHGWQPRLVLTASSMHYWATFTGPEFVDRGILAALNKPQYGTLESIQPNKYPDSKCAFPIDISSCSTAAVLTRCGSDECVFRSCPCRSLPSLDDCHLNERMSRPLLFGAASRNIGARVPFDAAGGSDHREDFGAGVTSIAMGSPRTRRTRRRQRRESEGRFCHERECERVE